MTELFFFTNVKDLVIMIVVVEELVTTTVVQIQTVMEPVNLDAMDLVVEIVKRHAVLYVSLVVDVPV